MKVEYHEINITKDEDAAEHVMQLNRGHRSVPTIVFPDGRVLTEPAMYELLQALDE